MSEKEKKYVSWTIFVWTIALIITIFGYFFNVSIKTNDRVDDYSITLTEIKVQLSQIQTDILWIKNKDTK